MKKDNRGFSLIEIIVVLAILAILSTGCIYIYQSLGFANIKKTSVSINDSMSKARIYTMSKKDRQYLYLYQIDGKLYSMLSTDSGLSIGSGGGLNTTDGTGYSGDIRLSYKNNSGTLIDLNNDEWICISFHKSSGAFDSCYPEIILKSRNETSLIKCVKETGRHWVD